MKRIISSVSILILAFSVGQSHADVSAFYQSIQDQPAALYAFLKAMPKGGELHYHLSGGVYAETMLNLAGKNKDFCIDTAENLIYKDARECRGLRAYDLKHKPGIYRRLLNAWSMQDFIPGDFRSGHDHFFASFIKFLPIISDFHAQLITDVVKRAANQNELYMEIMDIPDDAKSASFAPSHFSLKTMALARDRLLASNAFQKNIERTVDKTGHSLTHSRELLGCTEKPERQACQLELRFQYYVLREQPLNAVFAQALNGFEAASRSDLIVAVNLVQPEDGRISLRDYSKQMQIFAFMHQQYPNVHIALHAGELTHEYAVPENLRFHIREAIEVGHAERIGHGVDIAFEDNADSLAKRMSEQKVAVEINLESNRVILGVDGKNHPLSYYLLHKVPVVLSTDDEGILRTDLTLQYVSAANVHRLSYADLRQINRNALTYSFLAGESIWKDAAQGIRIDACSNLNSTSCQNLMEKSAKARLQVKLERALEQFEHQYSSSV